MSDDRLDRKFDVEAIRQDFHILQQQLPNGLPVAFLDSAASAQKPHTVIAKECEAYEQYYANAYRGVYRFGARIDEELEATRNKVKRFINAQDEKEIIFTSGATMSINLVAAGWSRAHLCEGDEIVLNVMEHHANFVPWQQAAQETGSRCRFVPLTNDYQLDLSTLDTVITNQTRVVVVTAMSNVLGTINPVRQIAKRAHEVGAVIVVDAAQSAPHMVTDVLEDDIDFLAFSGHKVYGPSGVGVLYGKFDLLKTMEPLLTGGHMIERVSQQRSTWADPPAKFEAGTLPIAQAIALGTAIDYLDDLDLQAVDVHEKQLLTYAHQSLAKIPGMRLLSPPLSAKGPIVSFVLDGAHPEDLAQLLDRRGVFVRHGHHCTMPLHEHLGIAASLRVSFGLYNTFAEIDQLLEAINFAREKLRLT
ncbi:MAG: SufS family cysteine desulfurase [Pirellulaceae bacterium]|nr:SufS family cysteine desulfurase [Pirellulaceae bacterium]